ncbi:EAL domain-containing protein [Salinicola aestuarinus]|uniref:EAL domain-containing protein n=1 Tax=Salinicola aestuarinus TaxID=1949082 RepID=UPI000DA173A8|nr:EAL domain-containing protein [Salinicola aestuarinus]
MFNDLPIHRLMQRGLLCCSPDTPLCEAASRMAERHCSSILIIQDERIAGIWTENDCLDVDFDAPLSLRRPVAEVMSRSVARVTADARVAEVTERFSTQASRQIVVVDADDKPVGIVSRTDLVRNQGLESYLRLREVDTAMHRSPLILAGEQTLGAAAQAMRDDARDAAIVRCEGDELGIITERDLVRFVARHPGVTLLGALASRPLLTVKSDDVLLRARDLLIDHRARHLGVLDADGDVVGLLGFDDMLNGAEQFYVEDLRDALDKRDEALELSRRNLQLAQQVIDSSLEGVIITDARARIEFVNPAFTQMTGYTLADCVGHTPAILSSGRHDANFYRDLWATLQAEDGWRGEIWNRRKSGELYLELLTITAIRNDQGEMTHYAALFSDITHLRENEERVRRLAYYDALTQLPNRRLLEDRLSLAIRHAHRHAERLAVIFIDLDHFKQINDTLGHAAGDELLLQVAQRLADGLSEDDSLARLGGDEFIAVLPNIDTPEDALHTARRLNDAIRAPFRLGEEDFRVGCSLGISLYPDDGETAEALMHHADAAMYRAKHEGRNTYRLYRADLHTQHDRRLTLESALRDAVETGEGFEVHYQPLFDRDSGELCSAEALMRWTPPRLGSISPGEFIPLAESSGLILPMGERLFAKVAAQLKRWIDAGLDPVPIAINLSARQFWQRELVEWIHAQLVNHDIAPDLITFELTESTLLDKQQQAVSVIRALRSLGCSVAIDDFGTGYSSLSYLQDLPINTLKIDQRFVQSLTGGGHRCQGSQAILAAVTGLAQELELTVVAEGVETQAQLMALERFTIHRIQGFLTGRPMHAEAFAKALLATRHRCTASEDVVDH